MTDELIRRLIAAGLNKQQATSVTAETFVKLFMPEDGKMLLEEARRHQDKHRLIKETIPLTACVLLIHFMPRSSSVSSSPTRCLQGLSE